MIFIISTPSIYKGVKKPVMKNEYYKAKEILKAFEVIYNEQFSARCDH